MSTRRASCLPDAARPRASTSPDEAISFEASARSTVRLFGESISITNGLPVPSMRTSISSLPRAWSLLPVPSHILISGAAIRSSTLVGYILPVKPHSLQPRPEHFLQSHFDCGMARDFLTYRPLKNAEETRSSILSFIVSTVAIMSGSTGVAVLPVRFSSPSPTYISRAFLIPCLFSDSLASASITFLRMNAPSQKVENSYSDTAFTAMSRYELNLSESPMHASHPLPSDASDSRPSLAEQLSQRRINAPF